jgi:hypothetical protein
MARQVSEILNELIATKNTITELDVYNSTSKRAIWRLWLYVVAVSIVVLEQMQDLYVSQVETILARSAAASKLWLQNKMFEFQYSATDPQIIQLVNLAPQYPVIDTGLRIITACSVTSATPNIVMLKVAKSDPYEALLTAEVNAAQDYIDTIGSAGISYNISSLNPDRIFIEGEIFFKGQYSAVIQTNVIATINNYFQTLSKTNFDGSLKMSDLEGIIRNVVGVNDVVLVNVKGRNDGQAFGGGVNLILSKTLLNREYKSLAGYMISEDTSGQTLADKLTFTPQ